MHSTITRRLDMVRRRMATAMAGELGTAARGAIRCKAASVSPIEVPSAADGAPGTVVRPAIRSRVASASRIAAIRPLKLSPNTAASGVAQIKEALLKELCKTRAEVLSTNKDHAADPVSTAACNLVSAQHARADDSRHCAAPRRLESFVGKGPVYFSTTY